MTERRPPGIRYAVNGQRVTLRKLADKLGLSHDSLRHLLRRARAAGLTDAEAPQWAGDQCAARYRCDL